MNDTIRLLNIVISNQQLTGKKIQILEDQIDNNTNTLDQIISNQNVINQNLAIIMKDIIDPKPNR